MNILICRPGANVLLFCLLRCFSDHKLAFGSPISLRISTMVGCRRVQATRLRIPISPQALIAFECARLMSAIRNFSQRRRLILRRSLSYTRLGGVVYSSYWPYLGAG